MPRGPATERRVPRPPVRGPDGIVHIGGGAGRRLPRGAPLSLGAVLAGEGALAPSGAEGPCPRTRGACGRAPLRTARPFTGAASPGSAPPGGRPALRWRSRRHPARASLPAPAAPAGQGPGARSAGTVRGRRFSCLEPGRPPCPPSCLKRNRRIIPRPPAPLREWACGPSRLRSFERSSTWRLTCGLHAFRGARLGHGALPAI